MYESIFTLSSNYYRQYNNNFIVTLVVVLIVLNKQQGFKPFMTPYRPVAANVTKSKDDQFVLNAAQKNDLTYLKSHGKICFR